MKYALVKKPGYWRDMTRVLSIHSTLPLARQAARRHSYIDATGLRRDPVVVISAEGREKGSPIYACNRFPDTF